MRISNGNGYDFIIENVKWRNQGEASEDLRASGTYNGQHISLDKAVTLGDFGFLWRTAQSAWTREIDRQ